ncbi:hypothetical protein RHE_CH01971 [Rhizobium etli CFN 42]|uniref:Uncharacterized protein n=1 Tax=Rhizobium etli (strain ATCC 51251 / DSM 11541 / JCM 21823 / NBRC 15573 / CFN 42) TaxID=347834 RepID=Q2K8T0_RHIEC|nr:hypothetical protein [Rhizobium etli]ABC90756.1 hypothetical protein RHE_CH01971 [Rhizobium etli CFN 42]
MNDDVALDLLQQEEHSLGKRIRDLNGEIAGEVRTFTAGLSDGERTISRIQDLYEAKAKLTFDLGDIGARIEGLETHIREQADLDRAKVLADDLAEGRPVAQEDYLDWLLPVAGTLESGEGYDRRHEGEEWMLQEMHRGDLEPEEYPDRNS